jgi:hypothetical protein
MNTARETEKRGRPRFAVMKDLTSGGRTGTQDTFHRLGELLATSKLHGTLRLRIPGGGAAKEAVFSVRIGGGKTPPSTRVAKPSVELITTAETWAEMAGARLSPLEAFLRGQMRVRGDVELAQNMMKHVAGSEGRTHLCGGE